MSYLEVLSTHPGNEDPKRQLAIAHAGLILAHEGVQFPQHPTVVVNPSDHPRLGLDNEWYRQAEQMHIYMQKSWVYQDGSIWMVCQSFQHSLKRP